MTFLIVSVIDESESGLIAKADAAIAQGANAVELRIDQLDRVSDVLLAYVQRVAKSERLLVTCRSKAEGGFGELAANQRAALLAQLASAANVIVDFEYHDWLASEIARSQLAKGCAESDKATHADVNVEPSELVILSCHDFDHKPADLSRRVEDILATGSVAKVAYAAHGVLDTFEALDLMHKHNGQLVAVAMGEFGLWTRVLSKKLNAFGTYSSLVDKEMTAPGQVSLNEMTNLYRWNRHDETTTVYGVIGDPISHSKSPALFNHWFEQYDINAVYVPIRVDREQDSLAAFLDECKQRPWLDLQGLSVTVPHKQAALAWASQGADPLAQSIGAANTLTFAGDDVRATNTDCYAAIDSIAAALQCDRNELAKNKVDVLGTGGAARAVLVGLRELGCQVSVYGRSADRTTELASEFGAKAMTWETRVDRQGAILINCTTVGMWPTIDRSPMPKEALVGCELVFDLIYNPLETQLLTDARKVGICTLNGMDMFVRQAAAQLALWTDVDVELELAKSWVQQKISTQK